MKHSRHVSMSGLKTPTSVLITPVVTITPVPLRYQVIHRTLQFPHNTFISTHIHAQWTPKKEREKETKEDLKKKSGGEILKRKKSGTPFQWYVFLDPPLKTHWDRNNSPISVKWNKATQSFLTHIYTCHYLFLRTVALRFTVRILKVCCCG